MSDILIELRSYLEPGVYLQLTTQCNQACAHCVFSCRPGRGEHMPLHLALRGLEAAWRRKATITLGGGEPTLYPHLTELLEASVGFPKIDIGLVTNGLVPEDRWEQLVAAHDRGVIDLRVSHSPFHRTPSPHVLRWLRRTRHVHPDLELLDRSTTLRPNTPFHVKYIVTRQGRAKRLSPPASLKRHGILPCPITYHISLDEGPACNGIRLAPDGRTFYKDRPLKGAIEEACRATS